MIKRILRFFANPRLWICLGLAWMITNGWSYVMLGVGTWLNIRWMQVVAGGYLAVLWIPATPEKILTLVLAIFFLKRFFPKDRDTLAVLGSLRQKAVASFQKRKQKKRCSGQESDGETHGEQDTE